MWRRLVRRAMLQETQQQTEQNFQQALDDVLQALEQADTSLQWSVSDTQQDVQQLQQDLTALADSLQDTQGALKRQEAHSGVTDAVGLWAVTFDTAFDEAPHVTVELVNPDENTTFRMTALTAAGFSVHVFRRTVLNILGLQVPSFAIQNVAAQACSAVALQR